MILDRELFKDELARYRELRQNNFGHSLANSRHTLTQKQVEYQKALNHLHEQLTGAQDQLNSSRVELKKWQDAIEELEQQELSDGQLLEEFSDIASLAGVQSIVINDKRDGFVMTVFVRIFYEDKYYDNEDWEVYFHPGQISQYYGLDTSVGTKCTRINVREGWERANYPRYRVDRYNFCFGGDGFKRISRLFNSGKYLDAASKAVLMMHNVNARDRSKIPDAFCRANDAPIKTWTEQAAANASIKEKYEELGTEWVKWRREISQAQNPAFKNAQKSQSAIDSSTRKLSQLQAKITDIENELDQIEQSLKELDNDATDYDAEYAELMGLQGVTSVTLYDEGVTLTVDRIVTVKRQKYNLGVHKLYLGPGFRGGLSRCTIASGFRGQHQHAPPFRCVDNCFDFYDLQAEIDKLCSTGNILGAAKVAIPELFLIRPDDIRRLQLWLSPIREETPQNVQKI